MIGPRQPSQKARRPPNLYIANPDSGSEDSNDELVQRPPAAHPTLTLITQPPTPATAMTDSSLTGVSRRAPSPSGALDVERLSPGGEYPPQAVDLTAPSSATSSNQSRPSTLAHRSSSSAGTTSSGGTSKHEPAGCARATSDTSVRSARPDRPLPTPSSPPSIPLPQPPIRHRLGSNESSSYPSKRELPHPSASPEIKRPLPTVDGSYSPVNPSPRPSISHPLPSLPGRLGSVRLQVTTDNENFSVVDVSNVANGEAIMDRVFSKLRFRDDDHPTLSMYRTDIGEAHDPKAITSNSLYTLCQSHGDSKGSLKFLVMQTALPHLTSSSAIPPPVLGNRGGHTIDYTPSKRSEASVSSQERVRVVSHSKKSSYSSASEILARPEYSSPTTGGETDAEADLTGQRLMRHTRTFNRRRLPSGASTSRSSKSPPDDGVRNFAHLASSPPFGMLASPSSGSELAVPPGNRRGSVTPTLPAHPDQLQNSQASTYRIISGRNDPFVESPPLETPAPSSATWLTSPSEPTEADLAVIASLEEEERERERRERIQLEEDRRVAMLEQQKEHEVWEIMQAQEREARQRQVETDRVQAELAQQQVTQQSRRDIERAERERERQVGKERRERRMLWENRLGPQGGAALDVSAPGWARNDIEGWARSEGVSPTSPIDRDVPGPSTYRQSPYNTLPARFVPPVGPPPRERLRMETHPVGYGERPTAPGNRPRHPFAAVRSDVNTRSMDNMRAAGVEGTPDPLQPTVTPAYPYLEEQSRYPKTDRSRSTTRGPSGEPRGQPAEVRPVEFPEPRPYRRGSDGDVYAPSSGRTSEGGEGSEQTWLVPPVPSTRSSRSETVNSASSSVTATLSPQLNRTQSEDDSGDTARAGDWAQTLGHMLGTSGEDESTFRPPPMDDSEETLWFIPPVPGTSSSPGRPALKLDTHLGSTGSQPPSTDATDIPSSTTDSEADAGAKVQRHKSFAKNKDQWNFRPPAEHVYEHLEEFFPKIDLDKPVVVDPMSPRTLSPDVEASRAPARRSGFNKLEMRKSIRVVAEGRKKHLSRIAPATKTTLERKRSSSMWGHRVVEVTPSKLKNGQIPGDNGAQTTMTWVKGDLIGKGTYGRVYLALNATTGDMIAVKQVEMPRTDRDREDARQSGMIEALKLEIALLKDLEHPNVVTYLGWEESSRYLSIFLEYVPGGSIASVYRKHKKFEEGVIKSFTRQILEGLAYLHSLHILHRDLKADNVLVDTNGICKISDFGISKRTDDAYDSIVSTNLKGSVFWMAPEVVHSVKGQGYSAKVDIWSLGCVVLEMWAGRRPWGDMEALAAMFQLANSRAAPPVPDDVILSPIADDFLNQQCFAPNPHDRPTAAELLAHRFITDVDPTWTFATSGIGRCVVAGIRR